MKKTIFLIAATMMYAVSQAQEAYTQQMQQQVAKLDKASTAKDYEQLANDFKNIADAQKTQWLPYYYAAFCNAKIGWFYQDDGDKIEPYADKAEEQIKKAQSLLDTSKQKKELSEVYCVLSMTNNSSKMSCNRIYYTVVCISTACHPNYYCLVIPTKEGSKK